MSTSPPSQGSDWRSALPLHVEGEDYDARYRWSLETRDGVLVLGVHGRVTQPVPESFSKRADAILKDVDTKRVVIDFSGCDNISSGAFGYLVRFFRATTSRGAQVLAVAPNERVRSLMRVLGLDAFLLTVPDHRSALRFYESQEI